MTQTVLLAAMSITRNRTIRLSLSLVGVVCLSGVAPSPATDSATYNKLKASSDALHAQQREVQRSYNEVAGQIDELRRRQGLLENYLVQLDHSIRDVDRALNELN